MILKKISTYNKKADVALDNFGLTVLAVIMFIALIAAVIIMMMRALN